MPCPHADPECEACTKDRAVDLIALVVADSVERAAADESLIVECPGCANGLCPSRTARRELN